MSCGGPARVKAKPAKPENRGAKDGVRDVVRSVMEAFAALPSPYPEACGDRRHTRCGVDDQPAREVDAPERLEEAADAPVPVRDRHVDERRPEDDVDQESFEPDSLCEGADDQGRRDRGELQLEREVQELRNRGGISEIRGGSDVVQPKVVQAPDECVQRWPEGERVPPEGPDQAYDRGDGEALGDRP